MAKGYWAEKAEPIVRRVLTETAGQEESVIRKALVEAYPFGPRKHWPYRAWCAEVRRQRGLLKHPPAPVQDWQLMLFGEEADPVRLIGTGKLCVPDDSAEI